MPSLYCKTTLANAIVQSVYPDSPLTDAMAVEPTFKRPVPKPRSRHGASVEQLLRGVLRELGETAPRDIAALLDRLGDALRLTSAIVASERSQDLQRRNVWNPEEREVHRSRRTWESWILGRKHAHQRDRQ